MTIAEERHRQFHKMLMAMREEVLEQVKGQLKITREKEYVGDIGDFATTDIAAEYAYLSSHRLRERLLLIDEALNAFENGDYGLCAECEQPINEKRLLLMPFTRFCVSCQAEIERRAKVRT